MSSTVPHESGDGRASRICLNCGARLTGPFCAQCGQHDIDYRRSFHHLVHEVLENLFHFDGKFLRSVTRLLARPGALTAEFHAGRRQSQVPPLRFYLFTSVLFFVGMHLLSHGRVLGLERHEIDTAARRVQQHVRAAEQLAPDLTAVQRRELDERVADAVERKGGDLAAAELAQVVADVRAGRGAAPAATEPRNRVRIRINRDSAIGRLVGDKIGAGEITMSSLIAEVEHRLPTALFIGMPLCALLLKLLFRRGGKFYIEHLVFSVHLHTWFFLVTLVGLGGLRLAALGPFWLWAAGAAALAGWMLWYSLQAFRVVYGLPWRATVARCAGVGLGYGAVLLTLLAATIFVTLAWEAWA